MDLLGGMLLGGSLFGGSPFAASSSDMAAIASSLGILGSFISMIWCCGGRGFFYPSKEDSAGANEGVERGLRLIDQTLAGANEGVERELRNIDQTLERIDDSYDTLKNIDKSLERIADSLEDHTRDTARTADGLERLADKYDDDNDSVLGSETGSTSARPSKSPPRRRK